MPASLRLPSGSPVTAILALGALLSAGAVGSPAAAQEEGDDGPAARAADECVIPGPPHPDMSEEDRALVRQARGTDAVETVTVDGRELEMARVGSGRFARWNCVHDLLLVVEERSQGPVVELSTYHYQDEYTVTRWRLWMQEGIGPASGGRRGEDPEGR